MTENDNDKFALLANIHRVNTAIEFEQPPEWVAAVKNSEITLEEYVGVMFEYAPTVLDGDDLAQFNRFLREMIE